MFITVSEAARIANRSHVYIFKLVSSGRITGMRSGSRWMVDEDALRTHFHINRTVDIESVRQATMRTFGVEIEFLDSNRQDVINALARRGIQCTNENYNHDTRATWKIVNDGSLTSSRNGSELVSPILCGDDGYNQIRLVCEALAECGAQVDKSCGLHVHFGIDDLSVDDVRRVVVNYNNNRLVIDSFMAPSRRFEGGEFGTGYHYCRNYDDYTLMRMELAHTIEELSRAAGSDYSARYRAVNLKSYTRHGTIEFRQHQGSVDCEKIVNWIRFLMNLVNESKLSLFGCETIESLVERIGLSEEVRNFFIGRARHFARMGA